MADWIDRLQEEITNSTQARQQEMQTLHSAAYRTWDFLKRQLDTDIAKANQRFKSKIGEIAMVMPESNQLRISKTDYPAYYITVTLDTTGKTIKIEREVRTGHGQGKKAHPEYLQLNVDNNGELVISREGQDFFWDALPEILLRPIILSEKV